MKEFHSLQSPQRPSHFGERRPQAEHSYWIFLAAMAGRRCEQCASEAQRVRAASENLHGWRLWGELGTDVVGGLLA